MNWKEASKMPDKGYGWFAVATLPRNHSGSDEKDSTDLAGDNEWRKSFGFTIAWLNNGEWYEADHTGSRRTVNITRFVTHWDHLPEVPTMTEPFKYPGAARYSERQGKELMQDFAMKSWEEDQKTNPNPVNPYAYSYGFLSALRLIGLR